MKKILEKVKKIYYIYILIIIVLISIIVFDYKYYDHISKDTNHNPYDIIVDSRDNFVFLGDSITDFYPLEEFFDELPVINSGVAGYTTDDILKNIDNMVYIYNPTKVFILIGTNDIQMGKDEEYIYNNIKKIVKEILKKRPDTKIYIESIYPINNTDNEKIKHEVVGIRTNSVIKNINKKLKSYCKDKKYTYINVYDKLIDKEGNLDIKYTEEGLHMSVTGYLKVTKTLYEYLND